MGKYRAATDNIKKGDVVLFLVRRGDKTLYLTLKGE